MTTTNIQEFKTKRKIKKAIDELSEIQKLLSVSLQGFSVYKKYTPVKEVLRSILDNKAIVDLYLKKFKKILENPDGPNKLE
jgi:DNA-binding ferritin-like protein